ncbi:MAG: CHAT domain-containing protein, partial [bacterium]
MRRNLASLYVLMSDYPLALEHLARAHYLAVEKNFAELTWRVEHAIGTICRSVQLPPENLLAQKSAVEWYHHAIQILESLPEEPEGSEQRLAETAEELTLYENAVTLLVEQGEPRAALELAERARSNRFVNLVSARYILPKKERQRLIWGGRGGSAPFWQRNISRLRGELTKLEAEDPQRPKELARVRHELAKAEREYQKVVNEALAEDPELASFFSIQAVDTQALQDSLDAETAILEYFVTENELILWLITHENLAQTRVPLARQQLRERIANLRQAWQTRRNDSAALSRELSALLLGSVRILDEYRRLIIVPDDGLHYLPFGALEYDGEPLVDLFALAKAPSLLALKFAERHQNLNENHLLVLRDDMAKSQYNDINFLAGRAADSSAQQLSGIKVEVLRGADWRAGEARQKIQQAGLLHIQHRFAVQPQRPLDSGFTLRLAANQNAAPDTALIPLYRLFELDLSASLVALENTAFPYTPERTRKGLPAGDEWIALQRSLIYAGTPTLVCLQWQAEPEIREIFFKAFYKNLASQPAIAALSAAQHAVREKFPDPHDWAGFELAGFAGMSVAEKSQFANRHFNETVSKGTRSKEDGEFLDAVRYYRAALTMAIQLGREDYVQLLYDRIKESAVNGHDLATACEIEAKVLEKALASNDIKQQAQSYRNLANWKQELKNYSIAAENESKRLELAERVKNPLAVADSRLQLARIFEAAGDYAAAIAQAEPAAEILKQQNQILPRFNAEILLGKLALQDDQYGAALTYLESAANAFLATKQPSTPAEQRALAIAYQLTGRVYGRLTAYGQALTFHQKALQLFEALADTMNLACAEQNLADTYWLNGDYQDALLHQQRSLKQARNPKEKLLGHST